MSTRWALSALSLALSLPAWQAVIRAETIKGNINSLVEGGSYLPPEYRRDGDHYYIKNFWTNATKTITLNQVSTPIPPALLTPPKKLLSATYEPPSADLMPGDRFEGKYDILLNKDMKPFCFLIHLEATVKTTCPVDPKDRKKYLPGPPTLDEILADRCVEEARLRAWLASKPGAEEALRPGTGRDPKNICLAQPGASEKKEQGGWILWNPKTGHLTVKDFADDAKVVFTRDGISKLTRPADTDEQMLVAWFHTHPNTGINTNDIGRQIGESYKPIASTADNNVTNKLGVPGIISTHAGTIPIPYPAPVKSKATARAALTDVQRRLVEIGAHSYLLRTKGWIPELYRLEHSGTSGDGRAAVVFVQYLPEERESFIGGGNSVELIVDLTRYEVAGENRFQ
jgi:hypothetical protein